MRFRKTLFLLGIIYLGFISLGLPDNVLGVSWEWMHRDFAKPMDYVGFITVLLTICSAISAAFSGILLGRFRTVTLLVVCGFLTGASIVGYSYAGCFAIILLLSIPLGFGQGAIDTGMNFYVAKHYTSRDMSWLHCCWGIGATLGPALMTHSIAVTSEWRRGYLLIGCIQIGLALIFLSTMRCWEGSGEKAVQKAFAGKVRYDTRFFCAPLVFFLYTGLEASMGLWSFQFLTLRHGAQAVTAGYAVATYWGMLTFGRFLIGIFANRLGDIWQIRLSMTGAVLFALGYLFSINSWMAMICMGGIGLCFAPFYPAMMHITPNRFDEATAARVIGLQGGFGMLGTAVVPALLGVVAVRVGFWLLPAFLIPVCLLILGAEFFLAKKP